MKEKIIEGIKTEKLHNSRLVKSSNAAFLVQIISLGTNVPWVERKTFIRRDNQLRP